MQVSVETTDGLERKLTVRLPAEQIQGAVDERLHSIKGTVRLDGFRPGKVPFTVVKKRFGGQVRQEVLGEVLQSSLQEAIVNESLRLAGMPSILPLENEGGDEQGFAYTATFEIFPEFELTPADSIEIERPTAEVLESDIDTMIENLRKQRASWNEVEREAALGDQVNIDFDGTVDGEHIPGGKAENTPLELGSGTMVPGFEEQLLGAKKGEDKTIQVTFPEDYQSAELAGKQAEFVIHVHSISEIELPEIDESFLKEFGVEEGGVAAFRDDIANNMRRQLEQAVQSKLKQAVMAALVEANTVQIPNTMVSDEIGRLRQQLEEQIQSSGNDETPQLDDALFREEAEHRVKLGLVVAEVIKTAELQANPDNVRKIIEDMAASYQEPEQIVNYYYQNQELLQNIEGLALEQEVIEWVVSQCKVTDVSTTFKEVMSRDSTG